MEIEDGEGRLNAAALDERGQTAARGKPTGQARGQAEFADCQHIARQQPAAALVQVDVLQVEAQSI